MTPTTAIQRAEQWRKENACGEAAKVAIALLNELERVQALTAGNSTNSAQGQIAQIVASLPLLITPPYPGMEKEISDFRKALEYQDGPENK